jgi:hypothetical protein
MAKAPKWTVEADYFTFCNCDWGCPCNFNARPTQGNCHGGGILRIRKGTFGKTKLDGVLFGFFYWFPGLIEKGNGTARGYIDRRATPAQREAMDSILMGKAGGGLFEVFHGLVAKWLPTMVTGIEFVQGGEGVARLKIGDVLEAESELLTYPDGTVIKPTFNLPHGIEFKTGLATNAKRWWVRDGPMLASHENVYGVITTVRFDETGCVG